jgi:general secretion pathway protein A
MYKEFFGLNRSPFDLSPDPFFMFASQKTREALASISYAVNQRKGFVVMTGEVGTGKTLVLRCLFELWEREQIPFAYFIGPRLSTIDFLSYITSELGINVVEPTKGTLLRALYGFLLAQFESGSTTVLVIDEAHQIPRSVLEEIRLLTNFETAQQKLVQIVLVGQPELDKKLDSFELRSLKQRIAMRCQLEPPGAEETCQYIERRLELAGAHSQAAMIFSAEAMKAIYRYSQGIPRLINSLCEQALLAAWARQLSVVPPEIVEEAASHFRLYPAPHPKQVENRPAQGGQITRSAPNKWPLNADSWNVSVNVPGVKAADSDDIPQQEHSAPRKTSGALITEALTGGITEPRNPEAAAVYPPSDRPAQAEHSETAPFADAPSEPPSPASSQDSPLASESAFIASSPPPSAIREPAAQRPTQSATGWHLLGQFDNLQSDRILTGSGPSLIRRSLEFPPRWVLQFRDRQVWARQSQGALKKALLIITGAVLVVGFAAGVIMAHRQNRVVAVHQAATSKSFPGGETEASSQPVAARPAMPLGAALNFPAHRGASGTSNTTDALEVSSNKIVMGALSRPVLPSPNLSNSAEPPPLVEIQANESEVGKGLLDISTPVPTPPAGSAGGQLQAPKLVSSPSPVYPPNALRERVQGIVVLDVLIDETGKVADMKVVSGPAALRQAAIDALRTWKYEPARLNGQPIAAHTQVNINFTVH